MSFHGRAFVCSNWLVQCLPLEWLPSLKLWSSGMDTIYYGELLLQWSVDYSQVCLKPGRPRHQDHIVGIKTACVKLIEASFPWTSYMRLSFYLSDSLVHNFDLLLMLKWYWSTILYYYFSLPIGLNLKINKILIRFHTSWFLPLGHHSHVQWCAPRCKWCSHEISW